ncbi:hypothetical protein [Arthrobacter sp. NPDC090010]|uniref:hypothetical protein n=1 Tax=Arthrobacter sp. NPDC090010 TaxID=3363942 RepID=UPI00380D75A5
MSVELIDSTVFLLVAVLGIAILLGVTVTAFVLAGLGFAVVQGRKALLGKGRRTAPRSSQHRAVVVDQPAGVMRHVAAR